MKFSLALLTLSLGAAKARVRHCGLKKCSEVIEPALATQFFHPGCMPILDNFQIAARCSKRGYLVEI